MEKFNIINLNEFSWPLNVALMGLTFSVFSLIYNEKYIEFGLVTFLFGVMTHALHLLSSKLFDEKSKYYWIVHMFTIVPTIGWIAIIICLYFK